MRLLVLGIPYGIDYKQDLSNILFGLGLIITNTVLSFEQVMTCQIDDRKRPPQTYEDYQQNR
jgi:hypothetical protein